MNGAFAGADDACSFFGHGYVRGPLRFVHAHGPSLLSEPLQLFLHLRGAYLCTHDRAIPILCGVSRMERFHRQDQYVGLGEC